VSLLHEKIGYLFRKIVTAFVGVIQKQTVWAECRTECYSSWCVLITSCCEGPGCAYWGISCYYCVKNIFVGLYTFYITETYTCKTTTISSPVSKIKNDVLFNYVSVSRRFSLEKLLKLRFLLRRTPTYENENTTRRQLLAYGDYSSIVNCQTKFSRYFDVYLYFFAVFQNNYVFVPQFLEETVTIFCVILGFSKTFLGNKRKTLLIGKTIQLWL